MTASDLILFFFLAVSPLPSQAAAISYFYSGLAQILGGCSTAWHRSMPIASKSLTSHHTSTTKPTWAWSRASFISLSRSFVPKFLFA